MAPVTGGKFRTYIVLEFPVSFAYKAYLENIENNDVIKKNLPKLLRAQKMLKTLSCL